MQKVSIKELYKNSTSFIGKSVEVCGWVKTIRDQKHFGFADLSDGSFFTPIQIVFTNEGISNYDAVAHCGTSAALVVQGIVVEAKQGKRPIEIQAQVIEIEGVSPPEYPLQPKRHSPEFLRTIAHLRPRTNLFSAVFKVRSVAAFAIHEFFNKRNFVYVHTPLITTNDGEGAGEMFGVSTLDMNNLPKDEAGQIDFSQDFFGRQTNLTVTGQLNVEAFAQTFKNVYTFGPTFRAEKSNTTRHAAEFWMIEPEIAFADINDCMDLAKDMLQFVIQAVLDRCAEEMEFFNQFVDKGIKDRLTLVATSDFEKITYTEAIERLETCGEKFKFPVYWGCDLQTEHERYLTQEIFKKPVFVTDYPKDIKAFYMRLNEDGKTVAAMDCLVPGIGEIIGGSQREERIDVLIEKMKALDMKIEDYDWYLDLRRYGSTHHAGYGLGFERLIMYLTGVSNIRDVIPYPRTVGSIEY